MARGLTRCDDGLVVGGYPRTRPRETWAWAAVVVAGVNTVGVGVALVVIVTTDVRFDIVEAGAWLTVVAGTAFPLLAALMLHANSDDTHSPTHLPRLAWLFVGFGVLCAGTVVVHTYADYALRRAEPLAYPAAWVASWVWVGAPGGFLLILLLFPTGELTGPRWRVVPVGIGAGCAAMCLAIALGPGDMTDFTGNHQNPLGVASAKAALHAVGTAGVALLVVCAAATVGSVGWRYRSGGPAVRDQLRLLLFTVALMGVAIALPVPDGWAVASVALFAVASLLIPVALGVALVRRDRLVLPRVLVFGLLSTLLLTAYLAVVGLAAALFGARGDRIASLVGVGVVAVAAAPLRTRIQRGVDLVVYGDRGNPYHALSDLGRLTAETRNDLLGEVVRAVAHALRCPYAAVMLAGDTVPAAAVGTPIGGEVTVPLLLRGREVGALVLSRRSDGSAYSARDMALVLDLARHIAVAVHAAALTADLQRSREQLVIAREEERRRIRRDLHDGLGPALAGIALGLDAARNTLAGDPDGATAVLAELKDEVRLSIADVRRLIYDLRPPALDRLGLVPAVEEYAARLAERGALTVQVSAPALPPLPAAVEVAAYRIATEALTNAARHSHARCSTVSFDIDDRRLRLEVEDDGVGLREGRNANGDGLGLEAMAERAAELGGTCTVSSRTRGGTSVTVMLPLRSQS